MTLFKLVSFFTSTLVFSSLAEAASNTYLPHHGRVSATVATTYDIQAIGGDGMLPLYGQQQGFAFADFTTNYGNNDASYLLSPGIGYRKIMNNQILGGYLFADYNRTHLRTNFWVLNPGIEWMSPHWDAHVNAYFPSNKSSQCGVADFASHRGDYAAVAFKEGTHNQYDNLVAPFAIIGNGVDAELGFSFAKLSNLRSRIYAGAYLYQPPSRDNVVNITGVTAGFEHPISKNVKLSIFNSYDNLNGNVVGAALTVTFGQDSMVFSNDINDRLLDPVQRHVGIINTGAGIYDQRSFKTVGQNLQYTNVYFIAPTSNGNALINQVGASNNLDATDFATYGHPAPLNQATLDSIHQLSSSGSRIYIQGGTGANYYVNSSTAKQSTNPNNDYGLALYSNQDLFGRSATYTTPATLDSRPQILVDGESNYNGFLISGTQNTLSDLVITTESGYINGTTPTTSTGIVAYNESGTHQSIQIINTSISGFADGLYAQNDSETGTMTINADRSNFDNNGGDQGLDNIQVKGYNNYGAAGLIALNNNGTNNKLVINATSSSFNNNGQLSGENSGINNSNFSIASGLIAINHSDHGEFTITADHSSFNNNGSLSGLNTFILANERGANGNSINTAAATGLYALDISANNGAMSINTTSSTFNNNGSLSGQNALIKAGGTGLGDNVNNAITAGIYVFNDSSFDSPGGALITLNANSSSFNNNGTLSGSGANINIFADNSILGASENAAVAAGVFSFNNSSHAGGINLNLSNSSFDYNGALSGANSSIRAETTGSTSSMGNPESVVASASGILAYNSNNQGSSDASTTVTASYSNFNNNGALNGNNATIQSINYNGYGAGSVAMASAAGMSGYNIAAGSLTMTATNSLFNTNGALTGTGSTVTASGTPTNVNGASGLFTLNNSPVSGNIFINSLLGSRFNNNGAGTTGYGIYAYTPAITGQTVVHYSDVTFGGAPQINTNQGISDGATQWVP
jgi:hypothetical protein